MTATGSQSQGTTANGIGRDELLAAVKADTVTIVDALPAHAYAADAGPISRSGCGTSATPTSATTPTASRTG